MSQTPANPERIDASFRYGSTIIIGVLTGFSLAFLTAWAANPIPWGLKDLPAIAPLVAGIVLELVAVWMLLDPRSLELPRYRRAVRWFMSGVVLVGIGVTMAIVVDLVALTENFRSAAAAGH
jgi:hypothetical protein